MASITIRNVDAETAAAVRRDAAARGRTLAAELRELAGRAGILKQIPANNGADSEARPAKRGLTTAEKLAIIDRAHAMQSRVLPCSAPLIRQVRKEWAARIDAKIGAAPMAVMTESDARFMRDARTRAMRARKRR